MTKKELVLNEIFELSPIDRADIVEKILTSFEFQPDKDIDSLWALEAEKRIDDYLSGKLKTKSMSEVFNGLNNAS